MTKIFSELINYVNTLFKESCIKIRQGQILDRNVLREMFETISRHLLSPFEQNLESFK